MKPRGSPGLWLILSGVTIISLIPVISNNAALREVLFTILLSITLASSLNIILGYTGYISFGHVVFFGLGGYVGLYLISAYGASLWIALPAAGATGALLAYLLGKAISYACAAPSLPWRRSESMRRCAPSSTTSSASADRRASRSTSACMNRTEAQQGRSGWPMGS
jgi:hypothetical protein